RTSLPNRSPARLPARTRRAATQPQPRTSATHTKKALQAEPAAPPDPAGKSGLDGTLELVHGVLFQLANTLGRDAVLGRQVMQGGLLFAQPALLHNVAAARVQRSQRLVQAGIGTVAPVGILELARRIVTMILEIMRRPLVGAVVAGIGRRL